MGKQAVSETGIPLLMRDRNLSRADLMVALDVSEATVRRWEKGIGLTVESLIQLAEFFQTTTDRVLGREEVKV